MRADRTLSELNDSIIEMDSSQQGGGNEWRGSEVVGEVPANQERSGPCRKVSSIPVRTVRRDRSVSDLAGSRAIRSREKHPTLRGRPRRNHVWEDTPLTALADSRFLLRFEHTEVFCHPRRHVPAWWP